MKIYETDSAEAMARVLAMTMLTDAKLDDRELEIMDALFLYEVLDLPKSRFSEIVKTYCDDLVGAGAIGGKINLMDKARIDEVIGLVRDPSKQRQTAQMIVNIMKADGHLHDAELALFRHVLERWNLTLDSLKGIVRPAS